jgi:hypothetical protein
VRIARDFFNQLLKKATLIKHSLGLEGHKKIQVCQLLYRVFMIDFKIKNE